MLELLHLSPQWVLQTISVLGSLKVFAVLFVIVGALLILPMLSPYGGGSLSLGLIGLLLLFGGFTTMGYANYEIGCLQKDRAFDTIPGYTFITSEYQPIMSLSDGQSYSMHGAGSFFLGIGSISMNGQTTPQYVFYKKLADGYQLGTIPAGDIIIKEDAEKDTSKIEWFYTHTVSEKRIYIDNGEQVGGTESVSLTAKYIHVPKGTVKVEWNLDSNLGGA